MESGSESEGGQRHGLRRSPLRRIGKTGRARNQASRQAATVAAAGQPARCGFPHVAALQVGLRVPCTFNESGVDPHHVTLRSADPSRVGDPTNIVFVCRAGHNAIHANPAKARELGLYNP